MPAELRRTEINGVFEVRSKAFTDARGALLMDFGLGGSLQAGLGNRAKSISAALRL